MSKPSLLKTLSGVLNISSCLIAVIFVLIHQDWFGKGDITAFLFWTIPLATGFSISGQTVLNLYKTRIFLLRLFLILLTSALISFGWVYFVYLILGAWINAFSFPIFYLWIIGNTIQLLFLDLSLPKPTEQQKLSKLFLQLSVFPLSLALTTISIFVASFLINYLNKPVKELYLIPDNFEGKFRVIYGEKCGIKPSYDNGRMVLKIPNNGVLIIQPKFKAGWVNNEYYLVDNNGNRKKLNELSDIRGQKKKLPCIIMTGTGSISGAMPDGSSSSESPLAIHYSDFGLYNKDTTEQDEKELFKFGQEFDSLTEKLVDDCRKKATDNRLIK